MFFAVKLPGCAEAAQQEIYRWCEDAARAGTDVVRLKIGDPFVFGRGGEEVLEFRKRLGIEAKIIPGISSVFSAPLLGGIPVTHRGSATQVVMSTGYGKGEATPDLQVYLPYRLGENCAPSYAERFMTSRNFLLPAVPP